jgi:AraC-like DNA-binding protein
VPVGEAERAAAPGVPRRRAGRRLEQHPVEGRVLPAGGRGPALELARPIIPREIGEATRDPGFGLDLALGIEIDALDALGFLFMTSADFGSALERMLRYLRLWNEGERVELVRQDDCMRLTYEPYGPLRPAHVYMAQATFVDMVINGCRFLAGLAFDRVRVRQNDPADRARFERVFGVPVEFGCATDEACFDTSMLSLPIPDANPALCAFFERYASEQLKRLRAGDGLVERLRALIRSCLPEGEVTPAALAPRLHMSSRTLQRRLNAEATSLQRELDAVRRQQALYFLENGTAIAELAWLLGYSEPSAFHRAFRRWTGTSPEAWRAKASARVT